MGSFSRTNSSLGRHTVENRCGMTCQDWVRCAQGRGTACRARTRIGFVSHNVGWGSRQDGGGAVNWVRFAFFGCWVLAIGSWHWGIGFVSCDRGW